MGRLLKHRGNLMSPALTSSQVWQALEKQIFAVLGMATANHETRTAGVVYIIDNRKLYISSRQSAWKVRHIAQNPHVSVTVPIHKQIPFLPWIKIPAATITFSGMAQIRSLTDLSPEILAKIFHGAEKEPTAQESFAVIEVTPEKEFITYGIGVSLSDMRDTEKSRGRVPVR